MKRAMAACNSCLTNVLLLAWDIKTLPAGNSGALSFRWALKSEQN
jgi:hypothetical protein